MFAINLFTAKTIADKYRLAAYYNKHCWQVFEEYQCWWHWTTL